MGWFWADPVPAQSTIAPHPISRSDATPPPGCPMHKASGTSSPSIPPLSKITRPSDSASACPYVPPDNNNSTTQVSTSSTLSKLNPLNYMPRNISNAPTSNQQVALPLSREPSTIPRGDGIGTWEYPSPQQMYNAMLKKGYTDTPAEDVPAMVSIHNFLNEGAWAEILDWENRFSGGLKRGWEISKRGEENAPRITDMLARQERLKGQEERLPSLVRFVGRPDEPTPKARMLGFMGWMWPSKYACDPPFDRHDWFVRRVLPDGRERELRYVIDYYSGPTDEETGEPVFFLDIRPALDSPAQAAERLIRASGDLWWRASGGSVREELERVRGRN